MLYFIISRNDSLGIFINLYLDISWVAVVTPTDRPKSVHSRFVIEL